MGRRVEHLDVGVGSGHLDLHHGVGLGDTTVSALAVPVGSTLAVEGIAIAVD